MSLITDILLLFASLGALFYCLILNRRLSALQNTNNGLGAAIASLTKSVRETKATLSETNALADEAVERLQPLIDEAKSASESLEGMLEQQVETGDLVAAATEKAGADLMDRLAPLIDQAHDIADALERHNKMHGKPAPAARPAARPAREELSAALASATAAPEPLDEAEPALEEAPAPEAYAEEPLLEEEEDDAPTLDEAVAPQRSRLARLRK